MKTYQKGFVIPLIISIIATLVIGFVVFVTQNKKVEAPVVNPLATSTSDITSDWKTYTNTQYSFSIQYPPDWRVDVSSPSSIYLISSKTDKMVKDWPNQPATQRTDLSILIEPYLYRLSGVNVVKNDIIFNKTKAEQVTVEDEEGAWKFIYLDKDGITYQITAANSDIEDVILGSLKFITTSTQPLITILSPNGGEVITAGKDYMINWWDDRDAGNTTIYLISSTGESKAILTNSFSRSSGLDGTFGFQWKVSGTTIPGNYKLKICKSDVDECGMSDIFAVVATANQTLSLWPDVNSFDLTNKTFEARGIGKDTQSIKNIKVYINSSTKFSSKDTQTSMNSFQDMYTMLKNWVGPDWSFAVKGVMQKDGSIVATEIYVAVQ